MDKIYTDFIDGMTIYEREEGFYLLRFTNSYSHDHYAFQVSKELFDISFEDRVILPTTIISGKEADDEDKEKLGGLYG